MIAFASDVAAEAADECSREAYRNGTEAQYSQFLDYMARSRVANGASSDREAKVLFAAMIGARLSIGRRHGMDQVAEERREG